MDFCDKCGTIMIAKEEKGKVLLVCKRCGFKSREYKPMEIAESVKNKPLDSEVIIIEKKEDMLPKTKAVCPECGNKEAFWWIQQTRSADEAPTLFLRCTKCKHSWREYG